MAKILNYENVVTRVSTHAHSLNTFFSFRICSTSVRFQTKVPVGLLPCIRDRSAPKRSQLTRALEVANEGQSEVGDIDSPTKIEEALHASFALWL